MDRAAVSGGGGSGYREVVREGRRGRGEERGRANVK